LYNHPFVKGILILLILLPLQVHSQTKTNLDVLYSLSDSLVKKICAELPMDVKKISAKLNLGEVYSVFSNRIKDKFIREGKILSESSSSELNLPEINIVFENAGVKYDEIERDGWFGDYLAPRTLFIRGNYLCSWAETGLENFYIAEEDTIKVDEINSLENNSFPFTKGNIPPEPFLSSLLEPVIAIGVAAISIILFFTVRSK
jgi:hypothetical protein